MTGGLAAYTLRVLYRQVYALDYLWDRSFDDAVQQVEQTGVNVHATEDRSAPFVVAVLCYPAASHGDPRVVGEYSAIAGDRASPLRRIALVACGLSDVRVEQHDVAAIVPAPQAVHTNPFRIEMPEDLVAPMISWLSLAARRYGEQQLPMSSGLSSYGVGSVGGDDPSPAHWPGFY